MESNFVEILKQQEKIFKNFIMKDYLLYRKSFEDNNKHSFIELTSKDYELQKYFEVRLEDYVRSILVNDVLCLSLKDKGVKIYKSELTKENQFYTNEEYENITGYEFIASYNDTTIMYRFTDVDIKTADSIMTDTVDQIIVINLETSTSEEKKKAITLSNGKQLKYIDLYEFFQEQFGLEEYQTYISFLTGVIIDFQEFIGVKSTPKLSPFELGRFRFEIEEDYKFFIRKIKDYIIANDKIVSMGVPEMDEIDYGYHVIFDDNLMVYKEITKTREFLRNSNILEKFENNKSYRYLIGKSDFAKSFITSEFLYKQYDCDDCFDYTAIVSGYLKSVEQLLYCIVNFSKNNNEKKYRIKNNGKKNKDNKYPLSVKEGKVYKIDFIDDNDGCFDTTIGSLIHFLDDYKSDLILVEDYYKKMIIDCLNCYRIECRNDSFHLDNNYNWSTVEFIRRNTYLVHMLLLSCCKLGDNDSQTQDCLQIISDDRLERLYNIVETGKANEFEFLFLEDDTNLIPIRAKYIAIESGYPSFDNFGRIKSILLTFEDTTNHKKMIIMRKNMPEEMFYISEDGTKIKID